MEMGGSGGDGGNGGCWVYGRNVGIEFEWRKGGIEKEEDERKGGIG